MRWWLTVVAAIAVALTVLSAPWLVPTRPDPSWIAGAADAQQSDGSRSPRTESAVKPTPPTDPPPPADSAVAFQEDSGHTGGLAGDALVPGLVQRWSINFDRPVGYPLVVPNHLYVTAGCSVVSIALPSGNYEWVHQVPFPPSVPNARELWCALAYDGGRVIAVDNLGTLVAYDALGNQLWLLQLPGNVAFSSPPTAAGGVVYVTGTGGIPEVYAVNDATGQLLWTSAVTDGFQSSPAVGPTGIYVGFLCQQVYGLASSGAALWHHSGGCTTGGGRHPVLAGGRLYVRDPAGNLVLDAQTGSQLGTFVAGPPPAFDGSSGYFVHDGVLDARDPSTMALRWTFVGDGSLTSAPIVVNGYVYVGSWRGNLFAVSAATGQSAWWANTGAGYPPPDGPSAPAGPTPGLAAGQGILAVPEDRTLLVYSGGGPLSGPPPAPLPPPPPPSPPPPPPPPSAPGGVVLGSPGFTPTGSSRPTAAWLGNFQIGSGTIAVADAANDSLDVLEDFAPGGVFTAGQRLPAGAQPSGVTGGRFRSSGLLDDAAVANAGSNTVTVYLNADGNPGGLMPGRDYPAGSGPTDVRACDLNRDTKLDLVVADRDGGTVSVLLGNGDGTFRAATQYPAGQTPVRLLCLDLDVDGSPDVVVANRDADALSVLRGAGTGALAAPVARSLHAGARPDGLTSFAFNPDGWPDVAVAEAGTAQTGVLLGLGGAQLGQEVTYPTGASPSSVAIAPGHSPFWLAVADAGDNDVTVLQALQDGSLTPFGRFPAGPGPVFVGAVGSGLIVADGGDGTVAALAELPAGAGYGPPAFSTGARPDRAAVADMDGDGHPEVVVSNHDFGSVTVLNGTGGARLGASHDYATGASQIFGLALGDVNGDGRPDVAVADEADNEVVLLMNTGSGLGPPRRVPTGVNPIAVAMGDFNRDGHLDLAVADFGHTNSIDPRHTESDVAILLGSGDGTFQAARLIPAGDGPTRVAVADLNGDAKLDVVNETDTDSGVWTEVGNGDGTFQAPVHSPGLGNLLDLTLGDLNGDGLMDAITSGTSLAEWLPGRGDGTFAVAEAIDSTQLTDSAEPGIAVGDLNRDGIPDVVTADLQANAAGVFVGRGGGSFYPRVRYPVGTGPGSVTIADVSGDGFPEVLVTDAYSGDVALMPNLSGQSVTVALEGTVVLQPTCPVQRLGSTCTQPLAGAPVQVYSGSTLVTTALTDSTGHYLVRLTPGQYVIRVANPSLPRFVTERTVSLSTDTVLDLAVNSGIL